MMIIVTVGVVGTGINSWRRLLLAGALHTPDTIFYLAVEPHPARGVDDGMTSDTEYLSI